MPTHRLTVLLVFAWGIVATALLLLRPNPELINDDHVAIYAAVIRDLRGPGALIDPRVLEPVNERMNSDNGWPRYHGQALLDALVASGIVGGICEPADPNSTFDCKGDLAGPVLAVSTVRHSGPHAVAVSILLHTVRTSRDSLYMPFAVEHEYELERQGASWAVTTWRRTMIT